MNTKTKQTINQAHLMNVLLKPHLSEKGTIIAEKHKHFVFKVLPSATKPEIRQAVEMLFGVKVKSVRVCNVKSKVRRFKQMIGHRNSWKKAYVALKEGHDIDFVGAK